MGVISTPRALQSPSTAVGSSTVSPRTDSMPQAHRLRRAGHTLRLVPVERLRAALRHRAERAAPRTLVAQNHEGRGAVFPALAHVRTAGALADGVKPEPAHRPFELVVVVT